MKVYLSDNQISEILKILENKCVGKKCLSRIALFEELKKSGCNWNIEDYQFEQAVTEAIKLNKLTGFKTRLGKHGGICRSEAFNDDKKRPKSCVINIGNKLFKVKLDEKQMLSLISNMFGGKPSVGKGQLHINNINYRLPTSAKPVDILENFVIDVLKGKPIE